jgi:hypothetical protein
VEISGVRQMAKSKRELLEGIHKTFPRAEELTKGNL